MRVKGDDVKMAVEFSSLESEDRPAVIQFLRQAVERDRQTGWEAFEQNVLQRTPVSRKATAQSRTVTAIGFLVIAAIFVAVWAAGNRPELLPVAAVNVVFAGYLLNRSRERSTDGN